MQLIHLWCIEVVLHNSKENCLEFILLFINSCSIMVELSITRAELDAIIVRDSVKIEGLDLSQN